MLGVIRALNRLECVGETLRHALNILAVAVPDWLRTHSQADWLEHYGRRVDDFHLPKAEAGRLEYAQRIGQDGQTLLNAVSASDAPTWLSNLPAVATLRIVWAQNYHYEAGQLRWRSNQEIPAASEYIGSPYDVQAHYSKKGTTSWAVIEAVRSGQLDETVLNDSVRRLLRIIFKAAETSKGGQFDSAAHHALARRAAAEGMVLLKNNGLLPLQNPEHIAVIGRSAQFPHY